MSVFDPTPTEMVEVFMAGGSRVSGEPLPELPQSSKVELHIHLQRIGVNIVRSPDRLDGWEDAFNAFADAFAKDGAMLSERQIGIDLPNMLFNFALRSGWLPHLTMLVNRVDLPDITSPKRIETEAFAPRPDRRGVVVVGRKEALDWFKDRIRPAVMERTISAAEAQTQCQPPPVVADETIGDRKQRRGDLLANFKDRVTNTNGKKCSDYSLYNARQHSMHKPQFFQWRSGELAASHPAAVSFERFLVGHQPPVARKQAK